MDQNYMNYGYTPVYTQLQSTQSSSADYQHQHFMIFPPQRTSELDFDSYNQTVPIMPSEVQIKTEQGNQYMQYPSTSHQNNQQFSYQHQNYLPPPPPMFQPMWHGNDGYPQVVPQYSPMGYHPRYMMPPPSPYQHMRTSPRPQLSPVPLPPAPFSCTDCNKSFMSATNLKRHWTTKAHLMRTSKNQSPETSSFMNGTEQTFEVRFLDVPNGSGSITDLSEAEVVLINNIDKELSSIEQQECLVPPQLPLASSPLQQIDIIEEFRCNVCSKTFSKRCYFTQHNKTAHVGHKPFKCIKCGKKYQTQELLDEHLMKHDGKKPFKCESCTKSFNHKTDLKRHNILHTTVKPHVCAQCGKGFVRKDHLQKHLGSHLRKMEKLKKVFTAAASNVKC